MTNAERRIAIGEAAVNYVRPRSSEEYARRLREFICDQQGLLRRRGRLVSPVRDQFAWRTADIEPADTAWFEDLTRARRAFLNLERDRWVLSPEIFLTWPIEDLVAIVARVFLYPATQFEFSAVVTDCLWRLDRWKFYLLVSKLRFYQSLFDKQGISKEELTEHADRVGDVEFWEIATRLHVNTAVRLLYLCVLERGCDAKETENWTRKIAEGASILSVLLDFLASPEYRRSFPDQFMANVENWAREEIAVAAGARPQAKPQAVWPVDESIHFNEDDPARQSLLGTNWHRREPQGRWSSGRTADIRFLMPETVNGKGATLTLRLRVAGTKVTGQRRIVAHCNRTELATITLDDDAPQNWAIPLPKTVQSRQGVSLLLVSDQDYSPAMSGELGDKRSLGVLLMEGRLTLDAPPVPEAESETKDPADSGVG